MMITMKSLPPTHFLGRPIARRRVGEFFVTDNVYSHDLVLDEHTHERPFVSICVAGAYDERIESEAFERRGSTAAFHHPHVVESARMSSRGARVLSIELSARCAALLQDARSVVVRSAAAVLPRLIGEMRRSDAAAPLAVEACVLEIIASMLRPMNGGRRGWLDAVLRVIHDRFAESLTTAELAEMAGVHPVHLAREFRKRTNLSIGSYIRELRVRRACDDLRTTRLPIAEIALRAGFADQSHLCRWIKRYTGVSPRRLRASQEFVPF
jgi:AraC family transcriptional regulator